MLYSRFSLVIYFVDNWASLIAQLVKNFLAMQETLVRFLGQSGRSVGEGIGYPLQYSWASFVAQLVKNLPAMWETWVRSLGWEDPLEKGKVTHCSILVWRIPWSVQSVGLQSQTQLSDSHLFTYRCGLKLNIQKTKIMASGPITSWQIDGETVETVRDFIFWGSKIIADGDCSNEIKRHLLLGRKVMTNLDRILKSRDINFANRGPSSQGYGFSSGHVWI